MAERGNSQRAVANDKVILAVAVGEIVDRVSLLDVGHVADLTHGVVYARHEDVSELQIQAWNSTLNDRRIAMFNLSRRAAEKPGLEPLRCGRQKQWFPGTG